MARGVGEARGSPILSGWRHVHDLLAGHLAIIWSLCRREVRTRFLGDALGYAWAYVLPLGWIAFILLLFLLIGRRSPVDAPALLFLLSGFLPYIGFRSAASAMARVHATSRRLAGFQRVSPDHIRLAVLFVEMANILLLSAMAWVLVLVLLEAWRPSVTSGASGLFHAPLPFLLGLLLAPVLGSLCAILVERVAGNPVTAARASAVGLRPFFYVSGVFFLMRELPPSILNILWWNPLLHLVDLSRAGIFHEAASAEASWSFVLAVMLVMVLTALFLPDPLRRGRHGFLSRGDSDDQE